MDTDNVGYEAVINGRWKMSSDGVNNWLVDTFTALNAHRYQYTGLADSNGAEIYEGDILKLTGDKGSIFAEVSYFNGTFTVKSWTGGLYADLGDMIDSLDRVTIDGTIYQNPELLSKV